MDYDSYLGGKVQVVTEGGIAVSQKMGFVDFSEDDRDFVPFWVFGCFVGFVDKIEGVS